MATERHRCVGRGGCRDSRDRRHPLCLPHLNLVSQHRHSRVRRHEFLQTGQHGYILPQQPLYLCQTALTRSSRTLFLAVRVVSQLATHQHRVLQLQTNALIAQPFDRCGHGGGHFGRIGSFNQEALHVRACDSFDAALCSAAKSNAATGKRWVGGGGGTGGARANVDRAMSREMQPTANWKAS